MGWAIVRFNWPFLPWSVNDIVCVFCNVLIYCEFALFPLSSIKYWQLVWYFLSFYKYWVIFKEINYGTTCGIFFFYTFSKVSPILLAFKNCSPAKGLAHSIDLNKSVLDHGRNDPTFVYFTYCFPPSRYTQKFLVFH